MLRAVRRGVAALVAGVAFCSAALADTITYFHNDIVGSPVAATNAARQVLWREGYRPYGERLQMEPASAANEIFFTSRKEDPRTELVYMGARHYDPRIGRFMATDPVGFDEGNIHSFNRYAYANNNPYKYRDPDGRAGVLATTILGAEVGTIVLPGWGTLVGGTLGLGLGIWGTVKIGDLIFNESGDGSSDKKSPSIDPADVASKTPDEIDQLANEKGLQPKGSDPKAGKGSYIDPATGEQRILIHGDHAHVNDSSGNRLDIDGKGVRENSPAAHLPIKRKP